jgi:predicted amidophosphoribosyltransferase
LTGDDDVVGAIAGVVLGLLGIAVLASIFGKPKCPRCGKTLPGKVRVCPYCGAPLEW